MTTTLFLLRAKQIGYTLDELAVMERGILMDIITEASNDSYNFRELAGQDDFDKF